MSTSLKIGCVVMAAGNARRYGNNKLAAQLRGRSLILRALEAVPAEQFDTVVVVTQYPEIMRLAAEFHFAAVLNEHPEYGISHTIQLGLTGAIPASSPPGFFRSCWSCGRTAAETPSSAGTRRI